MLQYPAVQHAIEWLDHAAAANGAYTNTTASKQTTAAATRGRLWFRRFKVASGYPYSLPVNDNSNPLETPRIDVLVL